MKFFKKISIATKMIFAGIVSALGLILFLFVRRKVRAKQELEYELTRLQYQIELAKVEANTEESDKLIEELKSEENTLKEKIRLVEEEEAKGVELSVDELDDFFAERGF